MQLTDLQRKTVRLIDKGEIFDLYSFISGVNVRVWGGEPSKIRYEGFGSYVITEGDYTIQVMEEAEALSQFKQFIALWDFLEQLRLIKTISVRQPPVRKVNIFDAQNQPHYTIMSVIVPYAGKEIVPSPGLKEFVERGFETEQEYIHNLEGARWETQAKQQQQATRVAQRWTIGIGITGILTGLFTVIFNYLTYKTDRNVTITNPRAFADTARVVLLPNPILERSTPVTSPAISDSSLTRKKKR
jgi:hypothetical protein